MSCVNRLNRRMFMTKAFKCPTGYEGVTAECPKEDAWGVYSTMTTSEGEDKLGFLKAWADGAMHPVDVTSQWWTWVGIPTRNVVFTFIPGFRSFCVVFLFCYCSGIALLLSLFDVAYLCCYTAVVLLCYCFCYRFVIALSSFCCCCAIGVVFLLPLRLLLV